MSKPKTLRVVPLSHIMTADSERHAEGIAFDLETGEAETLIALGNVVEVKKGEVEAGAPVTVMPADAPAEPASAPLPEAVEVVAPVGTAPAKAPKAS